MEGSALSERLSLLIRQHYLAIILASLGVICVGFGFFSLLPHQSGSDITFEDTSPKPVKNTVLGASTTVEEIVVDIEGAVQKPGVYHMGKDDRVEALITKSGGFVDTVNHEWVAKSLNLAAKLTDGGKLYIPFAQESVPPPAMGGNQSIVTDTSSTTGSISINNATADQLDSLPGVGTVTAGKIITNRPYGSLDDLVSKKAVSKSVFEKIKNQIVL